jgi:hypothetical protein
MAIKETVAWQVQQAMETEKITKVEIAKRMKTSRAALDRLLDPGNGEYANVCELGDGQYRRRAGHAGSDEVQLIDLFGARGRTRGTRKAAAFHPRTSVRLPRWLAVSLYRGSAREPSC